MAENNIYKGKKIDTKKAGFIRPARYFSNIQLSNSRIKDYMTAKIRQAFIAVVLALLVFRI